VAKRPAFRVLNRSTSTGGAARTPTKVPTKMGKKQISATRITVLRISKPAHSRISGATETLGTDWISTTSG